MRRLSPEVGPVAPRLARLADALAAPALSVSVEASADPAEQLQREHDQALETARRVGREQGLADADAEVTRRVDAIAKRLEAEHRIAMDRLEARTAEVASLGDGLAAAIAGHARTAEEVAVEAAFAALLRVLGERAADRSLVRDLCQQALSARGVGTATLRLAPEDREGLDIDAVDLQVVADPSLSPGQCILESPRGASDTGLDVRLEAMKRAFLAGLSGHRQAQ